MKLTNCTRTTCLLLFTRRARDGQRKDETLCLASISHPPARCERFEPLSWMPQDRHKRKQK